jgi:hypothetical protein
MNGVILPGSFPEDIIERVLSPPRGRKTPVLVNAPALLWRGADSVPVLRHAASTVSTLVPPSPLPHVPSIYERDIRGHPIALSPLSEVSRGFSSCSLRPSVLNLDADIDVSEIGTAAQHRIVAVPFTTIPEPEETVANEVVPARDAVDLRRPHPYDGKPFLSLREPSRTVADENCCGLPLREFASTPKLAMRWERCKSAVKSCVKVSRPMADYEEEVTSSGDRARYAVEKVKDRLVGRIVDQMGWRALF